MCSFVLHCINSDDAVQNYIASCPGFSYMLTIFVQVCVYYSHAVRCMKVSNVYHEP